MSTNNSSTFPLHSTFTGPTPYAGGTPEQYSTGPSQDYAYPPPETRNSRDNSGFMSPHVPRPHPSPSAHGHPSYHQPTHSSVGNPTIQMPQVQVTPVPSTASSAPLLMGETIDMPDHLHNIQPAPWPNLTYPLQPPALSHPPSQRVGMLGDQPHVHANIQGYQNELNDGGYPSGQCPPPTERTNARPKGPPGPPCGSSAHAHNSQSKCCGLC